MKEYERLKMLEYPEEIIDVVIDTDAATEVDDPFAIAYALGSRERLNVLGVYAAPFAMNEKTNDPGTGMEMSYEEIQKVLRLCGYSEELAFRGADGYKAPRRSPAAEHLIALSRNYGIDRPLYVAAMGAITNVATAILLEPDIVERIVVVWLAGNDFNDSPNVYNIYQDAASAQIIFDSGVPLVHVPCSPVTSHLITGIPELEACIGGKNELCDYLLGKVREYGDDHFAWGKQIWDAGVIAYLMKEEFTCCETVTAPVLTDNLTWSRNYKRHLIKNVKEVSRDDIFRDMYRKLQMTGKGESRGQKE